MDGRLKSRGYDVILVKDELLKTYQCPLCSFVLRKPIQTERGERACSECYKECYDKNPGKCPIDGGSIDIDQDIFLDRYLQRQVGELDCYCNNQKNGCPWKGKLRDSEEHLFNCLYVLIECEKCHESILLKNKEEHDNNECPERIVHCEYCGEKQTGRVLQLHYQKCPKRPIECPYQCNTTVLKEELKDHLLLYCQSLKSGKTCPYSIVGCTYKKEASEASPKDLLQHLTDDIHIHSGYLLQSFQKILDENEFLKQEIIKYQKDFRNIYQPLPKIDKDIEKTKLLQKQIESFEKEVKNSKEQHSKFLDEVNSVLENISKSGNLSKLSNLEDELSAMYKNYEEIESMINSSGKTDYFEYGDDVEKDLKIFSQKIEELESRNAILDANVVELKSDMENLESISYDGVMIWRIPNIMLKLSDARKGKVVTAMHSPTCYSKKGGYKFCTRMYLNGDGIGKGTHVSVFIVIMRTDYDVLLSWPFQLRVTFELIHPVNREFNKRESFLPDPNSSSFQRPLKEMNIAAGCPLFIRKEDLTDSGFLADDCIYIRTTVGRD